MNVRKAAICGVCKSGCIKGVIVVLVAGLALSMVGCDNNESSQPQSAVDISSPSSSSIDTSTPASDEISTPSSTPNITEETKPQGKTDLSALTKQQCLDLVFGGDKSGTLIANFDAESSSWILKVTEGKENTSPYHGECTATVS